MSDDGGCANGVGGSREGKRRTRWMPVLAWSHCDEVEQQWKRRQPWICNVVAETTAVEQQWGNAQLTPKSYQS